MVDHFLDKGEKVVTKEMDDVIRTLNTNSKTVGISTLLNDIEDKVYQYTQILHRLDDVEQEEIPDVLKSLVQERLLPLKVFDILMDIPDLSLPDVV